VSEQDLAAARMGYVPSSGRRNMRTSIANSCEGTSPER
jgi:hypothetical protein